MSKKKDKIEKAVTGAIFKNLEDVKKNLPEFDIVYINGKEVGVLIESPRHVYFAVTDIAEYGGMHPRNALKSLQTITRDFQNIVLKRLQETTEVGNVVVIDEMGNPIVNSDDYSGGWRNIPKLEKKLMPRPIKNRHMDEYQYRLSMVECTNDVGALMVLGRGRSEAAMALNLTIQDYLFDLRDKLSIAPKDTLQLTEMLKEHYGLTRKTDISHQKSQMKTLHENNRFKYTNILTNILISKVAQIDDECTYLHKAAILGNEKLMKDRQKFLEDVGKIWNLEESDQLAAFVIDTFCAFYRIPLTSEDFSKNYRVELGQRIENARRKSTHWMALPNFIFKLLDDELPEMVREKISNIILSPIGVGDELLQIAEPSQ
jgi:hypothetical protein